MDWEARHDSDAFQFTRPFALTAVSNRLVFWNHEQLGMKLVPGIDEASLALVTDAWSRTCRSRAVTFVGAANALETGNGVRIVPDQISASWPVERLLPSIGDRRPAEVLNQSPRGIAARYGMRTAYFVAMQLEYPRHWALQ
ncbi:hypothetical protein [Microvirga massiliensis]|uniref:hypothetical protein n=1 Tax=Microvirga massiliensis TaxID=1033741 RepID=UPI000699ECBC|nr:hypothetical protein [Microvirga massiliensis]